MIGEHRPIDLGLSISPRVGLDLERTLHADLVALAET